MKNHNIDGNNFMYYYNTKGQLSQLKYPTNFAVNYIYNSSGYLSEIRNSSNDSLIYQVTGRDNKYHQITSCKFGNNMGSNYEYNPFGLLTKIQTGTVSDYEREKPVQPLLAPSGKLSTILNSILYYDYTYSDNRHSTQVNMQVRPDNAIAEYHTHWMKPGKSGFYDINGDLTNPKKHARDVLNGFSDQKFSITPFTAEQYHSSLDKGHGLPSFVLNIYDASFHSGFGSSYSPIDPFISRFFLFNNW